MGYYSEVGLVLTKKANEELLEKAKKENKEVLEFLEESETFERKNYSGIDCVLYHWRSLKWYADFGEVTFMTEFMEGLDYKEYRFLRIGENYEDLEEEGGLEDPFNIYPKRRISIDLGTEDWVLSNGYNEYRVSFNYEINKPRFERTDVEEELERKIRNETLLKELKEFLEKQ